jgi:hypothetical protein
VETIAQKTGTHERIELGDLSLTHCAACGCAFIDDEPDIRGAVADTLFVLCANCVLEIQREPEGALAVALSERIERAALAHLPVGGHA